MPTADDAATKVQLRALAEGYAQGVDRRDVDTFIALFHPDAAIVIHDPSESTDPRELRGIERMAKSLRSSRSTRRPSTSWVSPRTTSATARRRARCTASRTTSRWMRMAGRTT